jgi:hypothetical protein
VPLLCSVRFGEPAKIAEGEHKADFLDRLKRALEGLRSV